jgi:hypothetical protein
MADPLSAPSGSVGRCGICGRDMKDYRASEPDDPAMDCGGDCLACVRKLEDGAEESLGRPWW